VYYATAAARAAHSLAAFFGGHLGNKRQQAATNTTSRNSGFPSRIISSGGSGNGSKLARESGAFVGS
jgi:hypothetical protein